MLTPSHRVPMLVTVPSSSVSPTIFSLSSFQQAASLQSCTLGFLPETKRRTNVAGHIEELPCVRSPKNPSFPEVCGFVGVAEDRFDKVLLTLRTEKQGLEIIMGHNDRITKLWMNVTESVSVIDILNKNAISLSSSLRMLDFQSVWSQQEHSVGPQMHDGNIVNFKLTVRVVFSVAKIEVRALEIS
jgi:hypothetical protein